ncbi:MAG: lysophospholipid acyltransferase family protein [Gammaproteobacteria bacterium]
MSKFSKQKFLGHFAAWVAQALRSTLDVSVHSDPTYKNNQQYLFAFWHGKQLLPVLELHRHQKKAAVLVSPSKDGEILATWLRKLNYKVLRGSSRQDNVSALKQMLQVLKAGYSLGFGIDGPIGPIYKVKPGMTYLSQRLNIPIVPVRVNFHRAKIFDKAWDRYELPYPFSKADLYLDAPWQVPKNMPLEEANLILENKLSWTVVTNAKESLS